MVLEDLVEERRRTPKHRERRGAHPGRLVLHEVGKPSGPLVVDLQLALGKANGIEGEHGRTGMDEDTGLNGTRKRA
jgi:hypothetical protein